MTRYENIKKQSLAEMAKTIKEIACTGDCCICRIADENPSQEYLRSYGDSRCVARWYSYLNSNDPRLKNCMNCANKTLPNTDPICDKCFVLSAETSIVLSMINWKEM